MAQIIAWSVGLAFQLVGVFIALVGVLSTQREYKDQDEPWMLDWVFTSGRWIARAYTRVRAWVRRVILRKPAQKSSDSQIGYVTGRIFDPKVTAWGEVVHEPLDDSLQIDEKVRLLDARSRQDKEQVNRVEGELRDERRRIDSLSTELEARTVEAKQHASDSLRAYATKGIKASALGLFLTALGMLCSALAQPPWA